MVCVTNDVVDLLPTAMVPKVNVSHDFLPIFSMVYVSVYVSGSLSELMQVYVYRLLVSNMQVNSDFYARLRMCMRVDTDTKVSCRAALASVARSALFDDQKQALNRGFDKG